MKPPSPPAGAPARLAEEMQRPLGYPLSDTFGRQLAPRQGARDDQPSNMLTLDLGHIAYD